MSPAVLVVVFVAATFVAVTVRGGGAQPNEDEEATEELRPLSTAPTSLVPSTSASRTAEMPVVTTVVTTSQRVLLEALARLAVKAEHTEGYEREHFGDWTTDGGGCSTRAKVLRDESLSVVTTDRAGCVVLAGKWNSEYDGITTDSTAEIEVDHVVPLKEAWESGAWSWTDEQRVKYANDLLDPRSLRVVTTSADRSKGDSDPAGWLPPRANFVCEYLADWITIKERWGLSIDINERDQIRRVVLDKCATVAGDGTAEVPDSTLPSASFDIGTADPYNVYYANCAEVRAAGLAPLYFGEPGYRLELDRDKDGVACES